MLSNSDRKASPRSISTIREKILSGRNHAQNIAQTTSNAASSGLKFNFSSHLKDFSQFKNAYKGESDFDRAVAARESYGGTGPRNSDSDLLRHSGSNYGKKTIKPGQVQSPPASIRKKQSFTRNNA